MDVLVCLAEQAGELLTRDQIFGSVWGDASVSDETLTRAIGEIRRTLGDESHEFIETVPKRGYRLVAEVLCEEATASSADHASDRNVVRIGYWQIAGISAAIVAAIAVLLFLAARQSSEPLPGISEAPASSIAVLPFRNLSSLQDDAYLVDGIHDDIVTQLAKLTFLDKVISRTSVERYRETTKSIQDIGSELGVVNVLVGGVQRAGDMIRINVQLVDTKTDQLLWAESFEKDLTTANLFEVQSDITMSIARELQIVMTPAEEERLATLPTQNLAAYDAFLKGKQAMSERTVASLTSARDYFESAIRLDPGFALAYANLADTISLLVVYGGLSEDEYDAAESAARRALRLDDRLGEAYAAIAFVQWRRFRLAKTSFEDIEENFKAAQRFAPGYVPNYQWYAMALVDTARKDEASRMMRRAIALDPLDPNLHANLGNIYGRNGDLDAAVDSLQRALEVDPAWTPAMIELGVYYMYLGDPVASVTWFRNAIALDPNDIRATSRLISNYLAVGSSVDAEYWYRRLQNFPETFWQKLYAIIIEFSRGNDAGGFDKASEWLAENPLCAYCVEVMAYELTQNGRTEEAVQLFADRWPELIESPESSIVIDNIYLVAPLAYALIESGDRIDAERLLAAGLDASAGMHRILLGQRGLGIEDVRMHLLLGEIDEAMFAFRQAKDAGWKFRHRKLESYLLDPLSGHPEYQALIAELDAVMTENRRRLESMEQSGELPPIP